MTAPPVSAPAAGQDSAALSLLAGSVPRRPSARSPSSIPGPRRPSYDLNTASPSSSSQPRQPPPERSFSSSLDASPPPKGSSSYSPDPHTPSPANISHHDVSPNVSQDTSIRSLLDSVDISSSLELLRTLQARPGASRHVSSSWSPPNPPPPRTGQAKASLSPNSSISDMRATNSSRLSSPQPLLPEHRKRHTSNSSLKSAYDEQEHRRTTSLSLKRVKKWRPRNLLHTPEKSAEKAELTSIEHKFPLPSPDRDREKAELILAQREMEDAISQAHLALTPSTVSRATVCRRYLEEIYMPIVSEINDKGRPPNMLAVARAAAKARNRQSSRGISRESSNPWAGPYSALRGTSNPIRNHSLAKSEYDVAPYSIKAFIDGEISNSSNASHLSIQSNDDSIIEKSSDFMIKEEQEQQEEKSKLLDKSLRKSPEPVISRKQSTLSQPLYPTAPSATHSRSNSNSPIAAHPFSPLNKSRSSSITTSDLDTSAYAKQPTVHSAASSISQSQRMSSFTQQPQQQHFKFRRGKSKALNNITVNDDDRSRTGVSLLSASSSPYKNDESMDISVFRKSRTQSVQEMLDDESDRYSDGLYSYGKQQLQRGSTVSLDESQKRKTDPSFNNDKQTTDISGEEMNKIQEAIEAGNIALSRASIFGPKVQPKLDVYFKKFYEQLSTTQSKVNINMDLCSPVMASKWTVKEPIINTRINSPIVDRDETLRAIEDAENLHEDLKQQLKDIAESQSMARSAIQDAVDEADKLLRFINLKEQQQLKYLEDRYHRLQSSFEGPSPQFDSLWLAVSIILNLLFRLSWVVVGLIRILHDILKVPIGLLVVMGKFIWRLIVS